MYYRSLPGTQGFKPILPKPTNSLTEHSIITVQSISDPTYTELPFHTTFFCPFYCFFVKLCCSSSQTMHRILVKPFLLTCNRLQE